LTLYPERCYKCGATVYVTHIYPDEDERKQTGIQVDVVSEDSTKFLGYVCFVCADKIPNSSLGYPPWTLQIYPEKK